MTTLPDFIKQGEPARLIPIVADSSKEQRIASVFLALLPKIPELASSLLSSVDVKIGKRTKIETFTEVVLECGQEAADRPDGLIRIDTGRGEWRALIEAKIGKSEIKEEQVVRYLELARSNKIDAVITISNQFVARADHPPVNAPKTLLRKAKLFHWPWMWVLTKSQLLRLDDRIDDSEQKFLLDEFVRFLEHPSTGVDSFKQMNKGWKDIVRSVGAGEQLKKNSEGVEGAVASWIEEQRDLCLLLSRHVGHSVHLKIERKHRDDPIGRLKDEIDKLIGTSVLSTTLQVPDAASDIDVEADLMRKCVRVGMRVKAPMDRKSTKARMNWLLRMLKDDDPRVIVRALWPWRAVATQRPISDLRDNPTLIQAENEKLVPNSFEVFLVEDLGGRFSGSRTFIEDVERLVIEFYHLVGQHVRSWQPPPPKPLSPKSDIVDEIEVPVIEQSSSNPNSE